MSSVSVAAFSLLLNGSNLLAAFLGIFKTQRLFVCLIFMKSSFCLPDKDKSYLISDTVG